MNQVLLVDDNPIQLKVRETILRGAGFQVAVATNAEIALALLRSRGSRVGIVITDHIMPGMNGVEFVRQLRSFDRDVPVVVLSGLFDVEEEYEGLDISFRQKPFPPPELIELIRTKINSRSAA